MSENDDRETFIEWLGWRWFHFRLWFHRCPECGSRGFYVHSPRWENDKTATMLGINLAGCPRCGKQATA